MAPIPRWRGYTLALTIGAAGVGLSCSATIRWQVRRLARDNPEVLYFVNTSAKAVALTIDDGPDSVTTPQILEVLGRHEAKATFFIITGRIPGNEALLRRMAAEGHELGNHMLRDEPSIKLPPAEFERQLRESDAALSPFAATRWFRPGSGRYDARMLASLRDHGYRCALGSVYPFDPQIKWSWFSTRFILGNAREGAIVILHDSGGNGARTVKTLSSVLPRLRERGFRIVTLTELAGLAAQATAAPCHPPPIG